MQLIRKFRDRHIEVLRVIVIIKEAAVGAVSAFFRILFGQLGLTHFKNAVRQARLMVCNDVAGTIRRELEGLAAHENEEN